MAQAASDIGQIDPYGIGAYQDYRGSNTYDLMTGTLVLPTCDGLGPAVIQTHDPFRVKRTQYAGVGKGRPTVMPRPKPTDVTLSHTHIQQLPVPFQSGDGNGFVYACAGGFTVLEPVVSASYECPRYPGRMEPMATEAEMSGFRQTPGTLVGGVFPGALGGTIENTGGTAPVRLLDPTYLWPSALTITPDFFSDQLS